MTNSPWISGFFTGLKPDTRLTVSEWSDQHRILPMKAAKEAVAGVRREPPI